MLQGEKGTSGGGDGEGDDINNSGENSPVDRSRGSGKSLSSPGGSSMGDCETALNTGNDGGAGSAGRSYTTDTAFGKVQGSLLSLLSVRGGGSNAGGNVNTNVNALPPPPAARLGNDP